jgi:hypothetical protein
MSWLMPKLIEAIEEAATEQAGKMMVEEGVRVDFQRARIGGAPQIVVRIGQEDGAEIVLGMDEIIKGCGYFGTDHLSDLELNFETVAVIREIAVEIERRTTARVAKLRAAGQLRGEEPGDG